MNNEKKWLVGIIGGIVLLCSCLVVICLAVGGLAAFQYSRNVGDIAPDIQNFPFESTVEVVPGKPTQVIKTPPAAQPKVTETPWQNSSPSPQSMIGAQQTLDMLESQVIPINDPRDLALRLAGKTNIPETMTNTPPNYAVGDELTFWASNQDTNENFKVNAKLAYVTPHLYFWIEDGVDYNQADLKRLCDTFESKIYPTNRDFFGSEWTPGIDNDPHLYVLFTTGIGSQVAGYFSSADEISPEAHKYSNAHEMFVINADNQQLDEEYTYSTIAHEFQHMIHWYLDRNEESWVNEGFSELAQLLNGYDEGGMALAFASDPNIQLTYWPSSSQSDPAPHYGAAFLFWTYFLDRFGDEATQAVVANSDNGMDSIDTVLSTLNKTDPETNKVIQADDVFTDWTVANYLNDAKVGDGRYIYKTYTQAPQVEVQNRETSCKPDWQTGTVHQYGATYTTIECGGSVTLQFEGATEVGVLPIGASSGSYAFWSNRADVSNMTLTREFDFTNVSGPITMTYSAWWDLETDYDYAYLEASLDGASWQILETPSGRALAEDPSGNAYGWGYNGQSDDYQAEEVDLSQYAGKKIQIRFEYVTDAAVNQNGFMLDDVSIPAIEYSTDFEKDDGGWEGKGFVRIENLLPQQFRISVIRDGKTVSVEQITLSDGQSASIPLQFDADFNEAVLVISGVTRFTTQEASYRFRFDQ